jgi:membrane-bound ClpP family serine protease
MTPLLWAILALALGLALVALELFIPSGGLLSLLAIITLVVSISFIYRGYGFLIGTVYLVGIVVMAPLVLAGAVRWWPRTPMGRKILNLPATGDSAEPHSPFSQLDYLLGKHGHAKSKMVLSGSIVVDGKSYDAISEGLMIEPGEGVKVVRVDGNRIVVRKVREDEQFQESGEQDILSRPASDVIPGAFEDPLA